MSNSIGPAEALPGTTTVGVGADVGAAADVEIVAAAGGNGGYGVLDRGRGDSATSASGGSSTAARVLDVSLIVGAVEVEAGNWSSAVIVSCRKVSQYAVASGEGSYTSIR